MARYRVLSANAIFGGAQALAIGDEITIKGKPPAAWAAHLKELSEDPAPGTVLTAGQSLAEGIPEEKEGLFKELDSLEWAYKKTFGVDRLKSEVLAARTVAALRALGWTGDPETPIAELTVALEALQAAAKLEG